MRIYVAHGAKVDVLPRFWAGMTEGFEELLFDLIQKVAIDFSHEDPVHWQAAVYECRWERAEARLVGS